MPGVIAEKALAHAFAASYVSGRKQQRYEVQTNERVYRLDHVAEVPLVGTLRVAEERDLHYLPYWMKGFLDECFHSNEPLSYEHAQRHLKNGTMYILEVEGLPVSMAGSTRRMPHGRSIGPVYTPPYLRGHGYATACVAMLSQRVLEQGYDYCVLFTNLANPTSNHIYQTIGYRPLGDVAEIRFSDEGRDPS
ncbi:MAG TPA: GNAT family N-acetyltransferase [Clostridia bacterium]|nr:GNAT family N-acetyltransferase [Clostridia bacterium]